MSPPPPPPPTPPPDRPVRGLVILLALLISACCTYTLIMFPPLLLLLLVPSDSARRLLRRWEGAAAANWLAFGGWLLETVGGVRIHVTGDALQPNETVMLLSNHRTRVDWMFMWCLAARLQRLPSYRVILKADLRSYPWWGECSASGVGVGWSTD
jgi:lysocardiolipin and lysophospholipid acyltransferase